MKKGFGYWIVAVLLTIWQIPQFIVALVMLPFMGKREKIADRHHNLCYKCSRMSGGISLGPICYVSEYLARKEAYVRHEVDGHTWDSKVMGPLYLLIVGIPSILNAAFSFTRCYYDFYPERWANKHAGVIVNDWCGLELPED